MDHCDLASNYLHNLSCDVVKVEPTHEEILTPIVYTTKLDEMKVFKEDMTSIDVDTFVNSIIKESKPKQNIKRKRQEYLAEEPNITYEDLSCHINAFNHKITRKNHIKNLIRSCKPIKIVLNDIKNSSLLAKWLSQSGYYEKHSQSKYLKISSPIAMDNSYLKPRSSCNLECTIIYDIQLEEADMYYIDNYGFVKKHKRIHINNDHSEILPTLEADKTVSKVLAYCCCWYERERFVRSLPLQPPETIKFMSKDHKCAPFECSCCCRQNKCVSQETSTENPSEPLNTWFKTIIERQDKCVSQETSTENPSETLNTSFKTIKKSISLTSSSSQTTKKQQKQNQQQKTTTKSFSIIPSASQCISNNNRLEKNLQILHSTTIQFEDEYYEVGPDGKISFFLKNPKQNSRYHCYFSNLISMPTNKFVGNNCCWYKREEFARHMLELGALPTTVTFIRNPHQCSTENCTCCCKPINSNKTKLVLFPMSARFTNDLVSRQLKLKLKFPKIMEEPVVKTVKRNTFTAARKTTFNISEFVSTIINTTLTESQNLNMIEKPFIAAKYSLHNSHGALKLLESISKAQFSITSKNITTAKIDNFKNISKQELKLLDFYFCVIAAESNKRMKPKNTNPEIQVPCLGEVNIESSHIQTYPILLTALGQTIQSERSQKTDPMQITSFSPGRVTKSHCSQNTDLMQRTAFGSGLPIETVSFLNIDPIQLKTLPPSRVMETESSDKNYPIKLTAISPGQAIEIGRFHDTYPVQLTASPPSQTIVTEHSHNTYPIQIIALTPGQAIETERSYKTNPIQIITLAPERTIETVGFQNTVPVQVTALAPGLAIETEYSHNVNPVKLNAITPDQAAATKRFHETAPIQLIALAQERTIETGRSHKTDRFQLTELTTLAPGRAIENESSHETNPIQLITLAPGQPIEIERSHNTDPLQLPSSAPDPAIENKLHHVQTGTEPSNKLSLCTQLSVVANLKSKRFLPPLRRYAQQFPGLYLKIKIESYDYDNSASDKSVNSEKVYSATR